MVSGHTRGVTQPNLAEHRLGVADKTIGHRRGRPPQPTADHCRGRHMLARMARLSVNAPKRVIGIAVLLMIAAAAFGAPAAKSLSAGEFVDPTSESGRAAA